MKKKILILGASGMLGNVLLKYFFEKGLNVTGYVRSRNSRNLFKKVFKKKIKVGFDIFNDLKIKKIIKREKPNYLINCIGKIKQKMANDNLNETIYINSVFPHKLAHLSSIYNFKLVHFSTDCVFNGKRGMYRENEVSNAEDIYGITKSLGEINKNNNVITIRTSIIGHEIKNHVGLLDWFLSQKKVKGFCRAFFSGFTTLEMAKIIYFYIFSNKINSGIYHISSKTINKYELLNIISKIYKKKIKIYKDSKLKINRSLISKKFKLKTGYKPPSWEVMIQNMYEYNKL